ncbi:U3 small nucleolar RNA-associated protein 13 [Rhizina undulata]
MAPPLAFLKTTFSPAKVIKLFYTAGKVSLYQSGKILVTTLNEDVLIVDIESGEELARIEGIHSNTASFASDNMFPIVRYSYFFPGSRFVHHPANRDSDTSALLKTHTSPIIVTEMDPTATLLATGGADGLVKLWDIKGEFVTHNFRGHSGVISALKFYAQILRIPLSRVGLRTKRRKIKKLENERKKAVDWARDWP